MALGYISEGERTLDIQSQQAATLHMITIRVILPQFTKIGLNRLRMGPRILHSSLLRDWRRKATALLGNQTLNPALRKWVGRLGLQISAPAKFFTCEISYKYFSAEPKTPSEQKSNLSVLQMKFFNEVLLKYDFANKLITEMTSLDFCFWNKIFVEKNYRRTIRCHFHSMM